MEGVFGRSKKALRKFCSEQIFPRDILFVSMDTADFHYDLPKERIALEPAEPRDSSRLMVLPRNEGEPEHRGFRDLPELLEPGDLLVINDTRVFPARMWGKKPTGAKVEALLVRQLSDRRWLALLNCCGKLHPGKRILLEDGLEGVLEEKDPEGQWTITFSEDLRPHLERIGTTPLPPYIQREAKPEDRERYQTVYAREEGSIAAPTAGLHFTPELIKQIEARGVKILKVTLHVGIGTFRPVKSEKIEDHVMHEEEYRIPPETLEALQSPDRGRVVAVGTTSVRTLESWAKTGAVSGATDLFIYPPYSFKVVGALVTNFHLPCSTLLMMISAFAGRERVLSAYREAVAEGYRFFSYGDGMLLA